MESAYCHESATCVLNHSLQTVYAKPRATKRMVGPRRPSRSHCLDRKTSDVIPNAKRRIRVSSSRPTNARTK